MNTSTATNTNFIETTTCPEGFTEVQVFVEVKPVPDAMHWATAAVRGYLKHEALYFVPMDEEGLASDRHISAIEKLHPGRVLVYL